MKRSFIWIAGIVIVLIILIVAGFVYTSHFANSAASDQQHKAAGAIQITPTPVTAPSATTAAAGATASPLDTYQIVSPQSTASYSVYENLVFENKPDNDAIGTTHSVTGSFQIRTGNAPLVSSMKVTVDLSTLQSDSAMRDNYVRQNTLQTDTYPDATFVSASTQGLPANYTNGQTIKFSLTGNLTLHGKTNAETFATQGKISGDTITGTATSTIYMTDFGIQPPDLANIAISQNKVLVTINFTATRQ